MRLPPLHPRRLSWALAGLFACCASASPPPAPPPPTSAAPVTWGEAATTLELGAPPATTRQTLRCPGVAEGDVDARGRDGSGGHIAPGPLQAVVADNSPAIIACYEESSLPEPRSGRVLVHWVIAPDGRVSTATIEEDTLESPAIERCLLEEICTWVFAAPGRESVTVIYPFVFDGRGF